MDKRLVKDKYFVPLISETAIAKRTKVIGQKITEKYKNKRPIFISILNGAFMFTSDLVRQFDFDCEIAFVKLASYEGIASSGKVKTVFGLTIDISNRSVIIVEDIVDTGRTMFAFIHELKKLEPASIEICTLLTKPEALVCDVQIDYIGFEIENKFVVGYGLDYDGYGRNYRNILQLQMD